MKNVIIFILTIGSIGTSSQLNSQDLVFFVDQSEILTNSKIKGPHCKSFADINGDHRDDIVRIENANILNIDIQTNNGLTFQNIEIGKFEGDAWTIGAGDLDNDGINEIMTAGLYNGMSIWKSNGSVENYTLAQSSNPDFFAQGSSLIDINNDGWLDVFICNDDGLSKIFLNDTNGNLIENSTYINMVTSPASDNSGNYSSVFTDVDGDNDLDLYISKCKVDVNSPTDPRRINTLFINDNGMYKERAEDFGIAIGAQTWASNFGDIDNDGDLDLFMINHDFRSMLFENIDNNGFIEIDLLDDKTELITMALESSFGDFNNDGFLDILISGNEDYLLINDKNNHFSILETPFGITESASFAIGDANEDGFLDVLLGYTELGELKENPDKLYINIGNENHFFALSLSGVNSNKNGIGSIVRIYGPWGVQTRVIESGSSYGITNSLTARFGTDNIETIDSLVVVWPSGQTDKYFDLKTDKHYVSTEGICIQELAQAINSEYQLNCMLESIIIDADTTSPTSNLLWTNNETTSSIVASSKGYYSYITDDNGCLNYSQTIYIDSLGQLQAPSLDLVGDVVLCEERDIDITSRTNDIYEWSTNEVDSEVSIEESGSYTATAFNICDEIESPVINISFLDSENFGENIELTIDTIKSIELISGYENTRWYNDSDKTNFLGIDTIFTGPIESDSTFYFEFDIDQKAPTYIGGKNIDSEDLETNFALDIFSPSIFFAATDDVTLKSFKVLALDEGLRKIQVISIETNLPIFEKEVFLNVGRSTVNLNADLPMGEYELIFDQNTNFETFGVLGAKLYISQSDVTYPYRIGDLAILRSSKLGEEFYPYFFDLQFQLQIEECTSGLYTYAVTIDSLSSTYNIIDPQLKLFPNPANEIIQIQSKFIFDFVNVFNGQGQLLYNEIVNNSSYRLNVDNLVSGIYFLELKYKEGSQIVRFIKK